MIIEPTTIMNCFKKYKDMGFTANDIADIDPDYLGFLHKNTNHKLSKDLIKKVYKAQQIKRSKILTKIDFNTNW